MTSSAAVDDKKPRKSGEVSDMVHRIKTLDGLPFSSQPIPREMISNPRVTIKPKGQE